MADKIKILEIQVVTPDKELADFKSIIEGIEKASDKVTDSLEKQYKEALKGFKASTKAAKDSKSSLDKLKDSVKNGVASFKNFTSKVGESIRQVGLLKTSAKGLGVSLKAVAKVSFKTLVNGTKLLAKGFALITGTGIVAIFSLLAKALSKTESGAKALSLATAAIEAGFAVLTKLVEPLGEQLLKLFSDPKQAIIDFKDLIKENIENRLIALGKIGKAIGSVLKSAFTFDSEGLTEAFEDLKRIAGEEGIQAITGASKDQQKALKELAVQAKETFTQSLQQSIALANAELNRAKNLQKLQLELVKLQGEEDKLGLLAGASTTNLQERIKLDEELISARVARATKEKEIADFELKLINDEIQFRKNFGQTYKDLIEGQTEALTASYEAEAAIGNIRLETELQREQDFQDNQEQKIDFLRDGIERQKTLRFTQLENEKTSSEQARQILDTFVIDSQKSFDRQIEEIQKFTDKKIDSDALLKETDLDKRQALIDELGLSELINKQLFDTITDRLDIVQETSEKELIIQQKKEEELEKLYQDKVEALELALTEESTTLTNQFKDNELSEEEFTTKSLELQKRYLIKRLELLKASGQATKLEVAALEKAIADVNLNLSEDSENRTKDSETKRREEIERTINFAEESFRELTKSLDEINESSIKGIEAKYEAERLAAEKSGADLLDIEKRKQAELLKIKKRASAVQAVSDAVNQSKAIFDIIEKVKQTAKGEERKRAAIAATLEIGEAASDTIFGLINRNAEAEKQAGIAKLDAAIAEAENAKDIRIQRIDEQIQDAEGDEVRKEELEERKQKIIENAAKKAEKLEIEKQKFIAAEERKAAKRRKAQAVIDSFIATGLASVQALPNLILSAIVAGLGLVQTGIIAAQPIAEDGFITDMLQGKDGVFKARKPLKKASRGYVVGGRKHAQGGTIIEAELGEPVVKADSYSALSNVVSWANQYKGGVRYPNTRKLTPSIASKLVELNSLPSMSRGGLAMPVRLKSLPRIPKAQDGLVADGSNNLGSMDLVQLDYLANRVVSKFGVQLVNILDSRGLNSEEIGESVGNELGPSTEFVTQ